MSDLKFELNKNEFVLDKISKKMYFVIKIDMHTVWLRDEQDPKNNDPEIRQMPKNLVNKTMIKVNPKVMEVLYGEKAPDIDIKPSFETDDK